MAGGIASIYIGGGGIYTLYDCFLHHNHGYGAINDIFILCTNLWMCLHVLVLALVEFATHVVQQCTVWHV